MEDKDNNSPPNPPNQVPEGFGEAAEKIIKSVKAAEPLIYGTGPTINATTGVTKKIGSQNNNQPTASPQSTKSVSGRKASIIVLLIALAMASGGFFILKSGHIPTDYITTSGFIVNEGASTEQNQFRDIAVTFEDQSGKSHKANFNAVSTIYRSGQRIQIAYKPANPAVNPINASDQSGNLMGIVLIGAGGLLSLLMLATLVRSLFKK